MLHLDRALRGSLLSGAVLAAACSRDTITSPSAELSSGHRVRAVAPTTSSVFPIGDTYLKGGTPNRNQGTETILRVQDSGNNRILIAFSTSDIAALVGDGSLVSATLQFTIADNGNNWGTSGRTISARRCGRWTAVSRVRGTPPPPARR